MYAIDMAISFRHSEATISSLLELNFDEIDYNMVFHLVSHICTHLGVSLISFQRGLNWTQNEVFQVLSESIRETFLIFLLELTKIDFILTSCFWARKGLCGCVWCVCVGVHARACVRVFVKYKHNKQHNC